MMLANSLKESVLKFKNTPLAMVKTKWFKILKSSISLAAVGWEAEVCNAQLFSWGTVLRLLYQ